MFISIEYSEPKILTWNVHHHSPSYLAVLFWLREKLARHVPLLDSPVNFAEQYSSLIVWQLCHYHDFSPKQLRSSEPFFNIICFPYVIASSCHKPIRYAGGCIFILLNDRAIGNLVAALQLAKQIAELSGFQKTS